MKTKVKYKKINFDNFKMNVTPSCFGLELYEANNYEPFSSEIIKYLLKPDSYFLDVGAYMGYYSLLAYHSQENVKVIALEPVKENFNFLKLNLKINGVKNFEVHNLAASNQVGIYPFNFTEASDCAGFYNHHLSETKRIINIETVTGDKVLEGRRVDFIKIDVEGHEIAVLEGLTKSTEDNDVILLVEFNPTLLEAAGHKPEKLLSYLKQLGFEIYFLDEYNRKYYALDGDEYSWRKIEKRDTYEGFCTNLLCIKNNNPLKRQIEIILNLLSQMYQSIDQREKQILTIKQQVLVLENQRQDLKSILSEREAFISKLKSSKFYKLWQSYIKVKIQLLFILRLR